MSRYFFMYTQNQLKALIDQDLKKQLIPSTILLDRLCFLTDESRKSSPYCDPRFVPFYYYLGKYYHSKSLLEIGFGNAMFSCAYFQSYKNVENFFGFQQKSDKSYNPRFGLKNVRRFYKNQFNYFYGNILEKNMGLLLNNNSFDLVLINEEDISYDQLSLHLDFAWEKLQDDGIITIDYLEKNDDIKKAFENFCKRVNRTPLYFKTRYTVGMLQK